jgi:hypothetical protein
MFLQGEMPRDPFGGESRDLEPFTPNRAFWVRYAHQARPEVWPREKLASSRSLWIYWVETQRPAGVSQRVLSSMVTLR